MATIGGVGVMLGFFIRAVGVAIASACVLVGLKASTQNALSNIISPIDSLAVDSTSSPIMDVSIFIEASSRGRLGGIDGRESSSGSSTHLWISSRVSVIGDTSDVVKSAVSSTFAGRIVGVAGTGSSGRPGPGSWGGVASPRNVHSELRGEDCSACGLDPGVVDGRGTHCGGE